MPRILIVDDEPKIAELINKYATFEGYDTVEVNDGMKAIEICKKEDFDIIVMDIMMPELDGFSAVREIRKDNGTIKNNIEENASRPVPEWLEKDAEKLSGKVVRLAAREDIDLPVEEHLIVELYSK